MHQIKHKNEAFLISAFFPISLFFTFIYIVEVIQLRMRLDSSNSDSQTCQWPHA